MHKVSLHNLETFLGREGDYTVRLLNGNVPTPERYIFALLRFDSNKNAWAVRFLRQNETVSFEGHRGNFLEAKRVLIEQILPYLHSGYTITAVVSGYYIPPWLKRKR